MAPIFKPLALASALFAAISSAAPVDLNKRENDVVVVWTTVTTVVWTTVDVTTTIYPTPQTPTPTPPVVESTPTPTPTPEQPKPIEASVQPETSQAQPAPVAVPTPVAFAAPAPEEKAPQPAPPAAPSASTTSQAPQSTPTAASSGSCSKDSPFVGQLTFYDAAIGSCGLTNDGFTENVVALSKLIMTDADCGKTVTFTYNGITKTGTVVDKCMGCDPTHADVSRHLFGELADMNAGLLQGVSWYIN
ncbi:hypothetical protein Aspvir_007775 [Aspergillus viridinutans]|uniref:Allergen Asp f 7 n=1 Tax=Aspergillus viridinutans TaxID=75553 RepID=A0A9P3F750_ASPVI|nr:uncharacterized protein Aspvir_007775 [Aspergillus viridinutans]GIK03701.1 hypothetical protein Aspvir_007775 [Aspergillus viridinutans]